MKKLYLVAMLLIVSGCETTQHQLSSLQRRSFESKDLEGKYEDAFKSTLQVLQDYGYIIKDADYQSGVIQGETGLRKRKDFLRDILVNFEITATMEQFGENKVKERLTLIKKSKYMVGEVASKIIEDPELFQRIYDDIQKEMFVRENLNK